MEGLYVRNHEKYYSLCNIIDKLRPYLWRVAVHGKTENTPRNTREECNLTFADRRLDCLVVCGWHMYDAGAVLRTPDWINSRFHRDAAQLRRYVESLPNDIRLSVLCTLAQNHPKDFQNVVLLSGYYIVRSAGTYSMLVLP